MNEITYPLTGGDRLELQIGMKNYNVTVIYVDKQTKQILLDVNGTRITLQGNNKVIGEEHTVLFEVGWPSEGIAPVLVRYNEG